MVVPPYLYEYGRLAAEMSFPRPDEKETCKLMILRAFGVVEIKFLCSEIQKLRGIASNMSTFGLEIS